MQHAKSLLCALLCIFGMGAIPAAANPLTLDFTGTWHHHDPEFWSPEFHAAMSSVGVDNGTPISWSLFLDDVDLNPDPARATYSVFSSTLSFGSLSLATGPVTMDQTGKLVPSTLIQEAGLGGWSMLFYGTMGAPVEDFRPEYLQLTANSPDPACYLCGEGFQTPIGAMDRAGLDIGFSHLGSGLYLGDTGLTPVAAIPEPEIYAMMGVGLAMLGWVGRRKRLSNG